MKTKLAVFDIDGTIFRSNLVSELVNGLVDGNIFPKNAAKEIERDYYNWLYRKGPYLSYIKKVVDVYRKYIVNCDEEEIKKVTKKILPLHQDKVYVFTRHLIEQFKKKDYYLLAISGSPIHMVSEFANYLGFDKSYGSLQQIVNGKFTGKEMIDASLSKDQILNKFLEENKQFGLKESYGIGDSEIDIPFLNMVGNPIAFNRTLSLAKHAKKKGWRIIVERKDVVYDLKSFDLNNFKV